MSESGGKASRDLPGECPGPAARAVRVALVPPQGLVHELDYLLRDPDPARELVGTRVVVPLGRRRATGVVTEVLDGSPRADLREVASVVDEIPVLDGRMVQLCRWMADYYLASFGDVIATALPGSLRFRLERVVSRRVPPGQPPPEQPADAAVLRALDALGGTAPMARLRARVRAADVTRALARLQRAGVVRIEETLARETGPTRREQLLAIERTLSEAEEATLQRRRPALHALYVHVQGQGGGPLPAASVRRAIPNLSGKLRALSAMGVLRVDAVEVYRDLAPAVLPSSAPLQLTAEQAGAVEAVVAASAAGAFAPFLLLGVTGSGKTEVYLRAIDAAIRRGRGALVLVPEISLTHQLVDRVRARFGAGVAVLHSGLSDGERWDEWRRLARGEARVAVGARSAVFAPVTSLGLVVVDEEHDGAYKQEEGVRYNARDVAVFRAQVAQCPVLLGSATPSMESFENGRRGRYRLLELRQRVEGRPLPEVEIVDLRRRVAPRDTGLPLSPELVAAFAATYAARGQTLVFLNRRGFANFLQCSVCGATLMCPNCSVALTLHMRWRALRCHHCDHTVRQPRQCPGCGEPGLRSWGAGTEQVETLLRTLVPGARVGRMDRDTASRRGAQRELLRAWEARQFDMLVGTQMVTKGHDIPGVTCVGVLLADQSLNFPDFRAAERTFQLLTQVAGRAGRGDRPGRVVVQTFQPRHYSLRYAAGHDYHGFAEAELGHRREAGYPPFSRLVLVRCDGEQARAVEEIARRLAEHVRTHGHGVQVLGPAPAPLERVRGRYHWQLLLRARQGAAVRRAAAAAREALRDAARRAAVRLVVDVDPYSML